MTPRPWHLRVAHPEQYCLEAADAIDAIALPPDKLEEYVRALVTTMRGVEKALREEGLARSAAAIAAVLAPFKGLEEP